MSVAAILQRTARYYEEKLAAHGPTFRGVDWNSSESQSLRFRQLLKACDLSQPFSVIDYGCGYGALVPFLLDSGCQFEYQGFDISAGMVAQACELHGELGKCEFLADESRLVAADYTIASGIFNVKQDASDEEWEQYVLRTLRRFAELSRRGFSFNVLTKYSDRDRMRPDLFYADPCRLFDFCKTELSRQVALLHDYGLYEFTMVVRFES